MGFGRCEIPEELPHALSGFVHLETLIRCHCDGAIRVQFGTYKMGSFTLRVMFVISNVRKLLRRGFTLRVFVEYF